MPKTSERDIKMVGVKPMITGPFIDDATLGSGLIDPGAAAAHMDCHKNSNPGGGKHQNYHSDFECKDPASEIGNWLKVGNVKKLKEVIKAYECRINGLEKQLKRNR